MYSILMVVLAIVPVHSLMCQQCLSSARFENCLNEQVLTECKGYDDTCFTLTTRNSNNKYSFTKGCANGANGCDELCRWHWDLQEDCMVDCCQGNECNKNLRNQLSKRRRTGSSCLILVEKKLLFINLIIPLLVIKWHQYS